MARGAPAAGGSGCRAPHHHNESDIPNRELARLIAVSQPLASAWLQETPYRPAARQLSAAWRVAVQRRLGLYLSDLVPALSAAAAAGVSFLVGKKASTPADPLGDSIANSVDFHPRHDAPLRALYDALSAVSIGKVILGDKNDKDYHKLSFYKSFNATHVPDLIRPGGSDSGKDEVYEFKVPSPLTKTATSHGATFAFGNTEHRMLKNILGTRASGSTSDPRFDPLTGRGHVKYSPGDYRDAMNKGHVVFPFILEALGGVGRHGVALLKRLARDADSPQGRDGTAYHRSCRSFFPHHARRIVRGAVIEDATSIHAGIRSAKMRAASRRATA